MPGPCWPRCWRPGRSATRTCSTADSRASWIAGACGPPAWSAGRCRGWTPAGEHEGTTTGIDEAGALLVDTGDGIVRITSGPSYGNDAARAARPGDRDRHPRILPRGRGASVPAQRRAPHPRGRAGLRSGEGLGRDAACRWRSCARASTARSTRAARKGPRRRPLRIEFCEARRARRLRQVAPRGRRGRGRRCRAAPDRSAARWRRTSTAWWRSSRRCAAATARRRRCSRRSGAIVDARGPAARPRALTARGAARDTVIAALADLDARLVQRGRGGPARRAPRGRRARCRRRTGAPSAADSMPRSGPRRWRAARARLVRIASAFPRWRSTDDDSRHAAHAAHRAPGGGRPHDRAPRRRGRARGRRHSGRARDGARRARAAAHGVGPRRRGARTRRPTASSRRRRWRAAATCWRT